MWETDGVTATPTSDLTILLINSGNRISNHSDLAFPFLPPAHAISAFWTLASGLTCPVTVPALTMNALQELLYGAS